MASRAYFFTLIGLFCPGFASDMFGDMTAVLLLPALLAYTDYVCQQTRKSAEGQSLPFRISSRTWTIQQLVNEHFCDRSRDHKNWTDSRFERLSALHELQVARNGAAEDEFLLPLALSCEGSDENELTLFVPHVLLDSPNLPVSEVMLQSYVCRNASQLRQRMSAELQRPAYQVFGVQKLVLHFTAEDFKRFFDLSTSSAYTSAILLPDDAHVTQLKNDIMMDADGSRYTCEVLPTSLPCKILAKAVAELFPETVPLNDSDSTDGDESSDDTDADEDDESELSSNNRTDDNDDGEWNGENKSEHELDSESIDTTLNTTADSQDVDRSGKDEESELEGDSAWGVHGTVRFVSSLGKRKRGEDIDDSSSPLPPRSSAVDRDSAFSDDVSMDSNPSLREARASSGILLNTTLTRPSSEMPSDGSVEAAQDRMSHWQQTISQQDTHTSLMVTYTEGAHSKRILVTSYADVEGVQDFDGRFFRRSTAYTGQVLLLQYAVERKGQTVALRTGQVLPVTHVLPLNAGGALQLGATLTRRGHIDWLTPALRACLQSTNSLSTAAASKRLRMLERGQLQYRALPQAVTLSRLGWSPGAEWTKAQVISIQELMTDLERSRSKHWAQINAELQTAEQLTPESAILVDATGRVFPLLKHLQVQRHSILCVVSPAALPADSTADERRQDEDKRRQLMASTCRLVARLIPHLPDHCLPDVGFSHGDSFADAGALVYGPTHPLLSVCSFNAGFLGIGAEKRVQELASELAQHDVVALQEIMGRPVAGPGGKEPQPVVQAFVREMHERGMVSVTQPFDAGPTKTDTNSSTSEYPLLFYRPTVLAFVRAGFLEGRRTWMQAFREGRRPYSYLPSAYTLKSLRQDHASYLPLVLTVISLHATSEESAAALAQRNEEFNAIADWIATQERAANHQIMIVGDFNTATGDRYKEMNNFCRLLETNTTMQYHALNSSQNTNVKQTHRYDNMIVSNQLRQRVQPNEYRQEVTVHQWDEAQIPPLPPASSERRRTGRNQGRQKVKGKEERQRGSKSISIKARLSDHLPISCCIRLHGPQHRGTSGGISSTSSSSASTSSSSSGTNGTNERRRGSNQR